MHKYARIVNDYARIKVLVIGDSMLDNYHFGRVERISQEAPVPVFIEESQKGRPGGAANVATNLREVGCQVESLWNTETITTKHRYLVGHQQIFRRDKDVIAQPTEEHYARLALADPSLIVLSDYAKGFLTQRLVQAAMAKGVPVVVDPKSQCWEKYRGATVICPNHHEMIEDANGWTIVEKRGSQGLRIHRPEQMTIDIPARAKQVFDVTGAGDTVTALMAASLATGSDLIDAAHIANIAAGIVVGKIGTAACSKEELLEALCA